MRKRLELAQCLKRNRACGLFRRRREPPEHQKLIDKRVGKLAPAAEKLDFVDSVGMKDGEWAVGNGDGCLTWSTVMAKVDLEAEFMQDRSFEKSAVPSLLTARIEYYVWDGTVGVLTSMRCSGNRL